MAMTKTEARELKPIVRRRKDQLLRELQLRRVELLRNVEKYLEDEKRVILDTFTTELEELKEELQPLIDRGYDLVLRMQKEGFALSHGSQTHQDGRYFDVPVKKEILGAEVKVDSYGRGKGNKKTLRDQIEAAYLKAKDEVINKTDEFLDNLTLQLVESEEAKDFIANLPTVDTFLPLPNGTSLTEILAVN
jgi:hypothetical protein